MKQFNKFKGTKGFLTTYELALRWRYMRNKEEVVRRVKILTFWQQHGITATMDAFTVSRRTLYRWQRALREGQGKLTALDPKSTAPVNKRKRSYDPEYIDKVINLRKEHPHLGKKKLAVLLQVSESYAGRTLSYLKDRGLLPTHHKLSLNGRTGKLHVYQKPKIKRQRRKHKTGVEIDTIVRFINGTKRYILTAIEVERKFAFAWAYSSHSSLSAQDFLDKLITVAPFAITEIQTDNDSEFAHHFHQACEKFNITHYHTYPRTPKMNAHIERFNRTLSEDFISLRRMLLAIDIDGFNKQLIDWLLWYNGERPHQSLGLVSPLQHMVKEMGLSTSECQKWWTSTCC